MTSKVEKSMDSPRTQILHLLKKSEEGLTTEEIRKALNVTTMAVSRQIALLEGQGLIRSELIRKPRGRPVHVFFLTDSAETYFPKTYAQLLLDLLTEVKAHGGQKRVRKLLDQRFRTLVDAYRQKILHKDFGGKIQDTSK